MLQSNAKTEPIGHFCTIGQGNEPILERKIITRAPGMIFCGLFHRLHVQDPAADSDIIPAKSMTGNTEIIVIDLCRPLDLGYGYFCLIQLGNNSRVIINAGCVLIQCHHRFPHANSTGTHPNIQEGKD